MKTPKKSHAQLLDELLVSRKQSAASEPSERSPPEDDRSFRTILNHTVQFIGLILPDGTVTQANRAALTFAGVSETDVLGKPFWETPWWTHSPEMQDQLKAAIQEASQGKLVRFEATHVAANGTLHSIDFSLQPVLDENGEVQFLIPEGRDITDRKAAEEVLRQSRAELQAIYDGMVDGIMIADGETTRFVHVNSSMCRMMQYTEEELLSLSVEDIHPPQEVARIREHFYALLEGRIETYENCPFLRKDGSVFYVDLRAKPITYHGRRSVIGFFHDITERKQAQEALERERRILQHMLSASDHERQLIAYEIHDGLAQQIVGALMQFEIFDRQKESKPKQAAEALQAGISMLRQSHVEARRLIDGVRPPILDESGVLAAIAHLVHEPRDGKSPKIEFQSRVHFNRLEGVEENTIYRIVQEGITNACNHSQSKKVRVNLSQQGNRLRITIRDWGIGFNPKALSEKRFGLTGIRERARLLGGKCTIRSKPGEGTTLIVDLPLLNDGRLAEGTPPAMGVEAAEGKEEGR